MLSEDRWLSLASHLGGRFAPGSGGGLHMGQPPRRTFHPKFAWTDPHVQASRHLCSSL